MQALGENIIGGHRNFAGLDHPAIILFLINVGRTMGMPLGDSTRIKAVEEVLKKIIIVLVNWCLRMDNIYPRYRIGCYAYSNNVYDIYSGVKPIDSVLEKGIPELFIQDRSNMDYGFRFIKEILVEEFTKWDPDQIDRYPAPFVIHMTDAEDLDRFPDPGAYVKEIMELRLPDGRKIPDGNVLIENIYFNDEVRRQIKDQDIFHGYKVGQSSGNIAIDKLISMSSILPEYYYALLEEWNSTIEMGIKLDPNIIMPFPYNYIDLIKYLLPHAVHS